MPFLINWVCRNSLQSKLFDLLTETSWFKKKKRDGEIPSSPNFQGFFSCSGRFLSKSCLDIHSEFDFQLTQGIPNSREPIKDWQLAIEKL